MGKRVALYARVSTDGQTCENQLAELRRVAERAGWKIVTEYVDAGVSGAKGRNGRPQFDALCRGAVRREFEMVAAWSVDRLGRSVQDLVMFLGELRAAGVDLYLHQEGMDTTTPMGEAMFQVCGVFAQLERKIIQERVRAGLERAKANGKTLGRPRVPHETEAAILRHRAEGWGKKRIARALGCGVGTVGRVLREVEPAGATG